MKLFKVSFSGLLLRKVQLTGALALGTVLIPVALKAQVISEVRGTVNNTAHQPVAGATVYLLNTNIAVTTNKSGGFALKRVAAGKYTVQVSAVGYASVIKTMEIQSAAINLELILPEASRQLDEVVVSAQKSDEQPQKLPLSLSAFSAKQVQDARLWNSKDITALVPNLYSASPGDNRNVTSIRGITTTSYDPAVATYIDGVSQFGLDT
jgi:iron complex outermembrane receptor protein